MATQIVPMNRIKNFGEKKARKALLEVLEPLLRLFPLWATTNLSARSSVSLSPGIFDLLVIDEASQCDIASTIPLSFLLNQGIKLLSV